MKINKIISIGSCCDSMFFCNQLCLREKGPVDNMLIANGSILKIYKLFNNDFFNSVINDNYYFTNYNHWDIYPLCIFDGYSMIHNDYRLEKTKIELIKRINKFQDYCNLSKNNKNYFFVYSTWPEDNKVSSKEQQNIIDLLPLYVRKKLLIINGRLEKYKFLNYPVFNYDTYEIRKLENQQDIQNKFSLWWEENKWFYENLNNCKYDNIKNGES